MKTASVLHSLRRTLRDTIHDFTSEKQTVIDSIEGSTEIEQHQYHESMALFRALKQAARPVAELRPTVCVAEYHKNVSKKNNANLKRETKPAGIAIGIAWLLRRGPIKPETANQKGS
ncbi:hypothetical protein LSAT2_004952 [Lamellibrachia satsuma]|nr:hypothetical protein LSAT2_004952 [Lamellibrachia satsuma]